VDVVTERVGETAAIAQRPIGVFDSGVGGLTVLRALQERLPHEHFVYLGDTARLPYGIRSADTVVRYALQAAEALTRGSVKALIVACNTASAVALPAMAARHAGLPVIGVVEPGAEAAAAASRNGIIAVIGTEATVRGGAYQRAIAARLPQAQIRAQPCQLFVALAEEGWTDGPIARATAERYLGPLFADARAPDTLVLGCTHFPMLRAVIEEVVGPAVRIVDSAATTALVVERSLRERGLLRATAIDEQAGSPLAAVAPRVGMPALRLLATDGVVRFAAVGSRFLGRRIEPREVELIDL
jgi:glutamate racemase